MIKVLMEGLTCLKSLFLKVASWKWTIKLELTIFFRNGDLYDLLSDLKLTFEGYLVSLHPQWVPGSKAKDLFPAVKSGTAKVVVHLNISSQHETLLDIRYSHVSWHEKINTAKKWPFKNVFMSLKPNAAYPLSIKFALPLDSCPIRHSANLQITSRI